MMQVFQDSLLSPDALFMHVCGQPLMTLSMNKAVSQSRANAELAQAFERPWRTPTHEEGAILHTGRVQNERIPNGWSIAGVRSTKQCVALFI